MLSPVLLIRGNPTAPNSVRRQKTHRYRHSCLCPTQLHQVGLKKFNAEGGKSLPSSRVPSVIGLLSSY